MSVRRCSVFSRRSAPACSWPAASALILVGHNAWFDLSFVNAAVARSGVKRCPFHPFSSFDTATLAGAAFGQTVLAKAATIAGLSWDSGSAHSASYDAERTAELFCTICNELAGSFKWAEGRARDLGWYESSLEDTDPEVASLPVSDP